VHWFRSASGSRHQSPIQVAQIRGTADPTSEIVGTRPVRQDILVPAVPSAESDFRRPVFHGIICEMRRAGVATIAKVLTLVSLPIVLAWGGWVLGTTWHPVMVPCRHPTGGPIIIGGTCFARPFWTRSEVLEAIGAATGIVVVAIMLIALRQRPVRLPPSATGLTDWEAHSAQ